MKASSATTTTTHTTLSSTRRTSRPAQRKPSRQSHPSPPSLCSSPPSTTTCRPSPPPSSSAGRARRVPTSSRSARRSPDRSTRLSRAEAEHEEELMFDPAPAKRSAAPSDVQVWSFDDDGCGEDGEAVLDIPISTFFSSSPSSFMSLAAYALPPVPSFDSLPSLLSSLSNPHQQPLPQLSDCLTAVLAFPPASLLTCMQLSTVLSALSSLILYPSLGERALHALAALFDAAEDTPEGGDVYIALVSALHRLWAEQGQQWMAADGIRWVREDAEHEEPATNPADVLKGPPLHARLLLAVRLVSGMQRRLPGYWGQLSHAHQQRLLDATMALYTWRAPPLPSSSAPSFPLPLSPLHFLSLADPQARWMAVWLYPTSMRRRVIAALSSPSFSSLLATLSSLATSSPPPPSPLPPPSLASPTSSVSPTELSSLLHLHLSSLTLALRQHRSGRRLLWCDTPDDGHGWTTIPRISATSLTPHSFIDRYVHTNQPVIITDSLTHWHGEGGGEWSVARLQSLLGELPLQNVFRSADGRFKFFRQAKEGRGEGQEVEEGLQRERRMTFGEFVAKAKASSAESERYYLYGEPLPAPLQPILTPPELLSQCPSLTSSLLWVSVTGSLSPLHFDLSDGVLAQLSGTKRFLLFPPSDHSQLAPYPTHHRHDRQSTLTLPTHPPSPSSLPSHTHPHLATLHPSELLFLPYGWWHQVESRSPHPSLTLTYRWNAYTVTLHRLHLIEVGATRRGLPFSVVARLVMEGGMAELPAFVAVWVMRRSRLVEEYQRIGLIREQ